MRDTLGWWTRTAMGLTMLALTVIPVTAGAAPCSGMKRLQLRWSKASGTALVSLSALQCDQPPSCTDPTAREAGTLFTKSPITVTITDAAGHSISGVVDASAASCKGRCERVNRGGCLGGADVHRVAGGFVKYVVNTQGQTTVAANKLKLPLTEAPTLVPPVTITVSDAAGYTVAAELRKCRVRQSGSGVAISCN